MYAVKEGNVKKLNLNEVIWFLILSSFAGIMFNLVRTGDILIYLHPRMVKFTVFSTGVFLILSIFQIRQIFRREKIVKFKKTYIVFIIPILLFLMSPTKISSSAMENKTVDLSVGMNGTISRNRETDENQGAIEEGISKEMLVDEVEEDRQEDVEIKQEQSGEIVIKTEGEQSNEIVTKTEGEQSSEETMEIQDEQSSEEVISKEDEQKNEEVAEKEVEQSNENNVAESENMSVEDEIIENYEEKNEVLEDSADNMDPFLKLVMNIYEKPEEYIGKETSFEGFVFFEDSYEDNQFIISRLMMNCCAADAYIVGLMCEYNGEPVTDAEWIRVSGTIVESEYLDSYSNTMMTIYTLEVNSIESIEPYDSPYVYYYY